MAQTRILKPATTSVYYAPLSAEEERATETLRQTLTRYFPDKAAPTDPPFGFLKKYGQKTRIDSADVNPCSFGMKLTYSYSAGFGDPLLDESCDPYPDGLLSDYAAIGINAVWLRGDPV